MYVHYGVMVRPGGLPGAGYLTGFYNSGTVVWVPPSTPAVDRDLAGQGWAGPARSNQSAPSGRCRRLSP
jgi:hypothetical protein